MSGKFGGTPAISSSRVDELIMTRDFEAKNNLVI